MDNRNIDHHIRHIHSGQDSMDQLLAQPQHQQISFQDSKLGMSSGRRDIQHIHIHKLHSMDQPLVQLLVQHRQISFQGSKPHMDNRNIDHHIQHIHSEQDSMDQPLAQLLVQRQQISFQGSKQGMSSEQLDIQHIHIHKLNSMDQPLVQLLIQRLKQMQIHTTLELMVMPDTHTAMLAMLPTQLIILERDLPMLNQKLNQRLIHTM